MLDNPCAKMDVYISLWVVVQIEDASERVRCITLTNRAVLKRRDHSE